MQNTFDCVGVTETWLSSEDGNNTSTLCKLIPDTYKVPHVPRQGTTVSFLHRDRYKVRIAPVIGGDRGWLAPGVSWHPPCFIIFQVLEHALRLFSCCNIPLRHHKQQTLGYVGNAHLFTARSSIWNVKGKFCWLQTSCFYD